MDASDFRLLFLTWKTEIQSVYEKCTQNELEPILVITALQQP